MKNLLLLIFLFGSLSVVSQIQSNNFEMNDNLDIEIGPNNSDSIWQIGIPQKTFFESALSPPNALMTDTINPYDINLSSSFILDLDISYFPLLQLEWWQKTDFEEGQDGGIIEASYDGGITWLNVLDDTLYRPDVVGIFQSDSLSNGIAGVTGTADWSWMALCWGTFSGTPPSNVTSLKVRFTFYSDSIQTNQEGWMIDDFRVFGDILGNVSEEPKAQPILIYPNPVNENFIVDLENIINDNPIIEIFDASGISVYRYEIGRNVDSNFRVNTEGLEHGVYFLLVKTEEELFYQKFIKVD